MALETIIISLGGSLVVPNEVDVDFIKHFKDLIEKQISLGKRFVIIVGGGKICRKYQDAGKKIKHLSSVDLDWLGIHATRFNAEFIKILFGDLAEDKIILDPTEIIDFKKSLIIGGGWKPGWSTDYDAVLLGRQFNANRVLNLSNIDYAYDKDPNKYSDAKKIENISWVEYRKLIPSEWDPGLSTPFDPIASKIAEEENLEVVILNGKNISNLEKCLNNESFIGTVIK